MKLSAPQLLSFLPTLFCSLCTLLRAQEPAPLAPVLSVSVNGARSDVAMVGAPVLIKVAVLNSTASSDEVLSLRLAADASPWTNALSLEFKNSSGVSLPLPIAAIQNVTADITLTNEYVEVAWWLPPERSAELSPGLYTFDAALDTTALQRTDSWRGRVISPPATLQLIAEPSSLSEPQLETRQRAFVEYHASRTNHAAAFAALDLLLASHPTNLAGLTLKSALLLKEGRIEEARTATTAAFDALFATTAAPPEPPSLLAEIQSHLETQTIVILAIDLTGPLLTLEWESQDGLLYHIETSENLRDWPPFLQSIPSTGSSTRVSTNVTGSASFYRVRR